MIEVVLFVIYTQNDVVRGLFFHICLLTSCLPSLEIYLYTVCSFMLSSSALGDIGRSTHCLYKGRHVASLSATRVPLFVMGHGYQTIPISSDCHGVRLAENMTEQSSYGHNRLLHKRLE